MYRKYTFLLVASLLILSSCGKEEIVRPVSLNINSTAAQSFSPEQQILFHYGFENKITGESRGWIIDKNGIVRTYDFTNETDVPQIPSSKDVNEESINNLYEYSTATDIQIDMEVLEKKYKTISYVANGRIDAAQDGAASEGTTSIVAYDYVTQPSDCSGCGTSDGSYAAYRTVILEISGEENQVNAMQAAVLLVDWLKEIKTEENL